MKISKRLLILIYFTAFSVNGIAESVPQSESDAARISMLEKALTPDTAEAVATLFAKANKERNGAVQFMLFSDQLKNKYKDSWPYWVSGVSSPWITSFTIKKIEGQQFQITYQWATASGPFKPALIQTITVAPVKKMNSSQKFWITQFNESKN
ncbi:MAG: hypothetical protein H0T84_01395 [Tatlockia sp.]|nr:hypothetical protein [Tatlockia sp.]